MGPRYPTLQKTLPPCSTLERLPLACVGFEGSECREVSWLVEHG